MNVINTPEIGLPIILADGAFPKQEFALQYLNNAPKIICCDNAIEKLDKNTNRVPEAIIGDLDSISKEYKTKYEKLIFHDPDQDSNDLTKAVEWCINNNIYNVIVLGATGEREDHTLGNISLLLNHSKIINWSFITDYGYFIPLTSSSTIQCKKGQQISIFSFDYNCKITSQGLKYPLNQHQFKLPWEGTLNEAIDNEFSLEISSADVIVFVANEIK